jgi:gas vesicle protein
MKFTSFVIGLGAGAAIAMLFAPRSGEETRAMISDKARESRRIAGERAREIRDMAGDKAAQLRDMANDMAERGRDAVSRQKNAVSAAVQAGKETYNREAQKTVS